MTTVEERVRDAESALGRKLDDDELSMINSQDAAMANVKHAIAVLFAEAVQWENPSDADVTPPITEIERAFRMAKLATNLNSLATLFEKVNDRDGDYS